jgi:hypothetical protein
MLFVVVSAVDEADVVQVPRAESRTADRSFCGHDHDARLCPCVKNDRKLVWPTYPGPQEACSFSR